MRNKREMRTRNTSHASRARAYESVTGLLLGKRAQGRYLAPHNYRIRLRSQVLIEVATKGSDLVQGSLPVATRKRGTEKCT